MTPSLMPVVIAVLTSFAVCGLLVLTQRWHGQLSLDHDLNGVQKIHTLPVPRIGGLGVLASLLAAALWGATGQEGGARTALLLLLCSLPVFAAGLVEDLTKRVPVRTRLLASFVSGALAAWLLGAYLTRLNTPGLDLLVTTVPLAVMFTSFAVGGVTNAINIIDGLNGLASGSVALMLGGLGAIAWLHDDVLVLQLCVTGIASMLGFMLLNYPFGRIFLGDGGAYLAGFWLAECAVLLLVRNPEVSTWAPLLACFYPVWETGFSMYRRTFVRRASSGRPDRVHFHHLLLRRFAGPHLGPQRAAWMRHGMASAVMWAGVLGCQILAAAASRHTLVLAVSALGFGLLYVWSYEYLVRRCWPTPSFEERTAIAPNPSDEAGVPQS